MAQSDIRVAITVDLSTLRSGLADASSELQAGIADLNQTIIGQSQQLSDTVAQINATGRQRQADVEYSIVVQNGRRQVQQADEQSRRQKGATDGSLNFERQAYNRFFKDISGGFSQAITGMILGTRGFEQSMVRLARTILAHFVDLGVKLVVNWIRTELAKTAATKTGNATRTASNVEAAKESGSADGEAAKKSIGKHAASAAAAVYDDVAQIPYVGWILAPPAAAAAFVAVEAFGSLVPTAERGFDVPADTFAFLHKKEMVLPAALAERVRDMTEPGGGPSVGTVVINATDADSFKRMLRRNPNAIHDAMMTAHRNFKPMRI